MVIAFPGVRVLIRDPKNVEGGVHPSRYSITTNCHGSRLKLCSVWICNSESAVIWNAKDAEVAFRRSEARPCTRYRLILRLRCKSLEVRP